MLASWASIVTLVVRGTLVPASHVDRTVSAYAAIIAGKDADVLAWKTAYAVEQERGRVQQEQIGKLLEHSGMSAAAWQSIKAEAERRSADVEA